MDNINIMPVKIEDIPIWIVLSHEYDIYMRELVSDLTVWYEGDENDIAFTDYMMAKITQNEAFMAIDNRSGICLGIVAFSIKNNRITFFAVSHTAEFDVVGNMLFGHALSSLDTAREITVTIVKSKAPHIIKEKELFTKYGFTITGSQLENGVPVHRMSRM